MLYILLLILFSCGLFYVYRRYSFGAVPKKLTRSQENANLIRVLLELDKDSREKLFTLYQQQFGHGAARYARQTYQKWKAGSVRPNKQTFSRFLINLPQVMSFDLKCEVLRELREAYCAHDNFEVTVSTSNWKDALRPLVHDIVQKSLTAELPDSVKKRLTWLAGDDVTVANAILAESQARESTNALSLLQNEFSNIEMLLNNAPGDRKVTHVLRLPLGAITLHIKKEPQYGR